MPKADTPPAYEEAISTPKYEDYQHPPQYSDPWLRRGACSSSSRTAARLQPRAWHVPRAARLQQLPAAGWLSSSWDATLHNTHSVRRNVSSWPSYYDTKAVFLAIGMTVVVCVTVTVFCFQTKVDFTSCGGLLCILAVLLMIIGIITAVVLSFHYIPWLHMLYAALGAVIYTLLALSPEEYVYGALSLYIDIVQIFLFILEIGGSALE
ncbi:hypothetical protein CRUP_007478 [Coryphaenoides rupestris]|nr:hypothetical protein CRUP_007478 [Coryphaenoides rupestris]